MIYNRQMLIALDKAIKEGIFSIENETLCVNGKKLRRKKSGYVALCIDGEKFYPKDALIVWRIFDKPIGENEAIVFVDGLRAAEDNVTAKEVERCPSRNPANRTYTDLDVIHIRKMFKNRDETRITYSQIRKSHKLSNPQISHILHCTMDTPFWNGINEREPALVKSQLKSFKPKPRKGTGRAEAMQKYYKENPRPSGENRKTYVKKIKVPLSPQEKEARKAQGREKARETILNKREEQKRLKETAEIKQKEENKKISDMRFASFMAVLKSFRD